MLLALVEPGGGGLFSFGTLHTSLQKLPLHSEVFHNTVMISIVNDRVKK